MKEILKYLVPFVMVLGGISVLFAPALVQAQGGQKRPPRNLESPRKFYSPGYVNESRGSEGNGSPSGMQNRDQAGLENPSNPTVDLETDTSAGVDAESAKETLPFAVGSGERPVSLRLLVAAQDPEHFQKNYGELLALATKLKLPFIDVFIVGDTAALFQSEALAEIALQPIQPILRYVRKVPEPFRNVLSSPTLVLETGQGVYLVEGYENPQSVFNEKGEFVQPSAISPGE